MKAINETDRLAKIAYGTNDSLMVRVVRNDNREFFGKLESFKVSKKGNRTLVIYSESEGFKSIKDSDILSIEDCGMLSIA